MRWVIAALCAGLTACTAEILPSQVGRSDTGLGIAGDAESGLDVASSTTTDGGVGRDALPTDVLPGDRGLADALADAATATTADSGSDLDADTIPIDVGPSPDAATLDLGIRPDAIPLDVGPDGGTIPDAAGAGDV